MRPLWDLDAKQRVDRLLLANHRRLERWDIAAADQGVMGVGSRDELGKRFTSQPSRV